MSLINCLHICDFQNSLLSKPFDTLTQRILLYFSHSRYRDNESKVPKNRKFHTGRNFASSKSFSDRIREASEEQQEKDPEFRRDNNLYIDDLANYINSVGKRGIHDEYHCIRTIPPVGTFVASK